MIRKTKIICTIGPASRSPEKIQALIDAGMNVARVNFSHGEYSEHENTFKTLKAVRAKLNYNLAIMTDTKGPEIRTGNFEDGKIEVKKGQKILITQEPVLGNSERFHISCPELFKGVKVGDFILVDDGKMRFDIIEKYKNNDILTTVHHTGFLKNHKSCNCPGAKIKQVFLSEKDKKDILFSIEHGADLIALSFVRSKQDILAVKELVKNTSNPNIPLIAKIENEEGYQNLDEILQEAAGILVARGDLGVEVSFPLVPIYQKKMIQRANFFGKPVITATHMLESMISNPRPTRAEASDVANAILDGSDAIMLSGETAVGEFGVEAVQTMVQIATEIEQIFPYQQNLENLIPSGEKTINDSIGVAAAQISISLPSVEAIVAFTETGGTARRICKFRPQVPIIALTDNFKTACELALNFGVYPRVVNHVNDFLKYDAKAIDGAKAFGLKKGATIILTSGWAQTHGRTNTLRIIDVTD